MDVKALSAIAGIAVLATIFYRAFLHPLAGIPGPRLASITSLWRCYHYARGTWHDDILAMHEKYGRVVRIKPNEVSIVDADSVKPLFGHGSDAKKTTWYNAINMPGPKYHMFPELDINLHSRLRKRIAGAYSMSSILRHEQYFQNCLDICFSKLQRHAQKAEIVDLSVWTAALAIDIVGTLGFGQDLGHMKSESDVNGLRAMLAGGMKILVTLSDIPALSAAFRSPTFLGAVKALGVENAFDKFWAWALRRIVARQNGDEEPGRPDMLSYFLTMKSIDGHSEADPTDIIGELGALIGAGSDTTSYTMSMCLRHLCSNPQAYKRLQNEIDNFYTKNNLSGPISYNQTQELPFLKAVVAETLRITPSISFQLLRYSPPGGMNVGGHYIPAGSSVGISPIAQNHDKAAFGEDAAEFRPERWLEGAERTASMERANMVWGGNGSRSCIGKNIALVEINKFIAQLLRNFDVALEPGNEPRVMSHWFSYQRNMRCKLKLRPKSALPEIGV